MRKIRIAMFALIAVLVTAGCISCSENFSNGDRVGLITKFNQEGLVWKTWEGELNITQTGMNTGGESFQFSVDRKNKAGIDSEALIVALHEALIEGHIVKVTYHKTVGKNLNNNRGDSEYFVTACEVLDKIPLPRIPILETTRSSEHIPNVNPQ